MPQEKLLLFPEHSPGSPQGAALTPPLPSCQEPLSPPALTASDFDGCRRHHQLVHPGGETGGGQGGGSAAAGPGHCSGTSHLGGRLAGRAGQGPRQPQGKVGEPRGGERRERSEEERRKKSKPEDAGHCTAPTLEPVPRPARAMRTCAYQPSAAPPARLGGQGPRAWPPPAGARPPRRPAPAHSLLLGLGAVAEEGEGRGQEEHTAQDHHEGAEHECITQAQELPERGVLGALADQVRDLWGWERVRGAPRSRPLPAWPVLTKPMR